MIDFSLKYFLKSSVYTVMNLVADDPQLTQEDLFVSPTLLSLIPLVGGTWRLGTPTCVLESDFGFILNCAFKKSGLFRVRNLGGVKAHIGLGFSVGDELGFKESLSNTEQNRRRSVQASKLQAQLIQAQQNAKKASCLWHLEKFLYVVITNNMYGFTQSWDHYQYYKHTGNTLTVRSPEPIDSVEEVPVSSMEEVKPVPMQKAMKKSSSSLLVPAFKPIPPAEERPIINTKSTSSVPQPALMGNLPVNPSKVMAVVAVPKTQVHAQDKISRTNFGVNILPTPNNDDLLPGPVPQHSSNSIQAILAANNVTEEALELALLQRQQMLAKTKPKTTTTTTTYKPTSKYSNSVGKVMNAPKEYYPVGYDKNFDDNFASRVELPETSFYCGDQKHFPGLYADEDLGCMVFHVCALTDDGLIMKSFLCPESTLFDQTILKCNCNIPISKSYQLMKALTFFSGYKKEAASATTPKTKEKD
ncbi:hypothetical protein NQ317_010599 [Molorchus minor]|uniref:Chitin-binding type-2 domain-containing protein n=1 Tax=Molorchus minor TaxID=1323400 RepID=A0ABQ9JS87_9CUCU|nr:hypothetical protein NQ317_010599 [Molorchus minor]